MVCGIIDNILVNVFVNILMSKPLCSLVASYRLTTGESLVLHCILDF